MQRPPSNARWTLVVALCVAGTVIAEPLPSWNDGAPKQALVEFVARVTRESSPDYVKPAERIAVFDNDGTLWAEQPLYFQFVFALDRIRTLAPAHPEWKTTQPFKAAIEGDAGALAKSGERALREIPAASHAVMTDEFATIVVAQLTTGRAKRWSNRTERKDHKNELGRFETAISSSCAFAVMRSVRSLRLLFVQKSVK
jgi:hypothetical protein